MLAAAAGLAVLFTGSLALNANANTLPEVGPAASPVQNVACWCGPYRCACGHRYYGPRYYGFTGPGGTMGPGSMSDLATALWLAALVVSAFHLWVVPQWQGSTVGVSQPRKVFPQ